MGERAQALVLLDQSKSGGRVQSSHTGVFVALVMSRRSPASALRQRLNAGQAVVEAKIEIDTLHLAVGDKVGAGMQLVVDRQAHRVADGFSAVVGPIELGVPGRVLA